MRHQWYDPTCKICAYESGFICCSMEQEDADLPHVWTVLCATVGEAV
jgi:hypothetical protein